MTADMLHVAEWHNGEKTYSPFSDAEMARRQDALRLWMGQAGVDAVLLTSPHGIGYFSGWINGGFGRKYGMVVTQTDATTISAGVDGGAPWRQSHGHNVTYTDWRRDNYYRAVRQLTARVQRLGIEFDHVSLDARRMLDAALPGVEMVDAGMAVAALRAVKSGEELDLLRKAAAIAEAGGRAGISAIAAGIAEHDVARLEVALGGGDDVGVEADRRAGRFAFKHAGEDADLIRLLPLRREARRARTTLVEEGLNIRL